jgi:hypothetical protein
MVRVKNWAYVVLSRVCTGLLPGEPIPSDIDFRPNPDYLEMMEGYETIFWLNP